MCDDRRCEGGTHETLAGAEGLQSVNQHFFGVGFEEVSTRPGECCGAQHFRGIMHSEDQNFRVRQEAMQTPRDFQPVGWRHRDIRNDDVRMQMDCQLKGGIAIASLATDLVLAGGLEDRSQTTADDSMIIGQQYP